jgi:hypothetical protein
MQEYIDINPDSILVTTGNRSHGESLHDLKTIMESLINNQGEEANIYSAVVDLVAGQHVTNNPSPTFMVALYLMISDAAIADAVNIDSNNVDEILDEMTEGDFEYKRLTPFHTARVTAGNGTNSTVQAVVRADITKQLRRASKKLVYSAILATNPEFHIVAVCHSGGSATIYATSSIHISYDIRTKQARML